MVGYPAISADGRYVAFYSVSDNLVPGDTNGYGDILVHDRVTSKTTRVSVATGGTQASWVSYVKPAVSADGRYVAFVSSAPDLVPGDRNGRPDAFIHDRSSGETTRVSVATDGAEGDGSFIYVVAMSSDGRFVAFDSASSTLVPDDSNKGLDVFIHDRDAGATTRVSVAADLSQGNGDSMYPAISGNGQLVAFTSDAGNLVTGDTNIASDIFVRDRGAELTAPTSVTGGAFGSTVTLAWHAPAAASPTAYFVEGGSAPGRSDLIRVSTGSPLTWASGSGLESGNYYFRVRATNTDWTSAPSAEVQITVGGSQPPASIAPGPPAGLTAAANGSTVTLSWHPPSTGGPPSSYTIEAGSATGLADLAGISTGNTTTSFVATSVANRQYFVRVRSANAAGSSEPSNEASVLVSLAAPGAPSGLAWRSAGSSIWMAWSAPTAGGAPVAYSIEAGSAPGLSNLAVISTVGPIPGYWSGGVPDGTYFVRVRSTNAAGTSGPSNEVSLVVGCTAPPGAPGGLRDTANYLGKIKLVWTAPAAPFGNSNGLIRYVLEAGSAPGLSDVAAFDLDGTEASAEFMGVPFGTYYIRVKARNLCGTSGASNEFRLQTYYGDGPMRTK